MGAIVRNVVNDQLLRLSYKDPKNIKRFLRNWGGLEGLQYYRDNGIRVKILELPTTLMDLSKLDNAMARMLMETSIICL